MDWTQETYGEPSQRSKMKLFVKIINRFQPLTLFAKISFFDVWLCSECVPECRNIRAVVCVFQESTHIGQYTDQI